MQTGCWPHKPHNCRWLHVPHELHVNTIQTSYPPNKLDIMQSICLSYKLAAYHTNCKWDQHQTNNTVHVHALRTNYSVHCEHLPYKLDVNIRAELDAYNFIPYKLDQSRCLSYKQSTCTHKHRVPKRGKHIYITTSRGAWSSAIVVC